MVELRYVRWSHIRIISIAPSWKMKTGVASMLSTTNACSCSTKNGKRMRANVIPRRRLLGSRMASRRKAPYAMQSINWPGSDHSYHPYVENGIAQLRSQHSELSQRILILWEGICPQKYAANMTDTGYYDAYGSLEASGSLLAGLSGYRPPLTLPRYGENLLFFFWQMLRNLS